MNKKLYQRAQQLANRAYSVTAERDTLSDGTKVYLMRHPELSGCMSHGMTLQEAEENLLDATIEYIYSLLLDNFPVPEPRYPASFYTNGTDCSTVWTVDFETGATECRQINHKPNIL